jgi:hypothetical protein
LAWRRVSFDNPGDGFFENGEPTVTTGLRSRSAGIDYELVFKLMPGMRLATAYAAAIAGGAIP